MRAFEARTKLLEAAASCLASELYFQTAQPGPNDDAECEYKDELLLQAARDYVAVRDQKQCDPPSVFSRGG